MRYGTGFRKEGVPSWCTITNENSWYCTGNAKLFDEHQSVYRCRIHHIFWWRWGELIQRMKYDHNSDKRYCPLRVGRNHNWAVINTVCERCEKSKYRYNHHMKATGRVTTRQVITPGSNTQCLWIVESSRRSAMLPCSGGIAHKKNIDRSNQEGQLWLMARTHNKSNT